MRRRTVISLLTVGTIALAVSLGWPWIDFWMLTGRFVPIENIETLKHPVAVSKWTPAGLLVADGQTVSLPGLNALPADSAALSEAVKRGVEIREDGRVWALVQIHHWCGNDPVREHIARVDLSDMLTFLRIGEPTNSVPQAKFLVRDAGGSFSESGWDIGEFLNFQSWQSMKRLEQ